MKVEVLAPQEYIGDVIGDVMSRRGQVQSMDSRGNDQLITAIVPLARLFGYFSALKHMTRDRATHTMVFSHYQPVPPALPDGDDTFPQAAALRQGAILQRRS
jgi:elongation factor G